MISDEDILAEQRLSGYEYLSKAIDLAPTEQLVAKLVSGGIFTYQAFLSFLEHEYYRSFRKKRELFVLILKLRVGAETFDKEENLLPQAVLDEVIKRVSALLAKRDIFAHYQHGNFIILRSNASAGQLENLSRRIIHAIMSDEWLTPECSTASLHSVTQICSVQPHPSLPELVALVPIKY
jgi:GGDEF domain-containing protein